MKHDVNKKKSSIKSTQPILTQEKMITNDQSSIEYNDLDQDEY